jgi:hypothetical protein
MGKLAGFKFADKQAKAASASQKAVKLPSTLVDGTWVITEALEAKSKADKLYYKLGLQMGAVKETGVYISQFDLYTLVTREDDAKNPEHLNIDVPENFAVQIKGGYYAKATGSDTVLSKHERFRKEKGGVYANATDTQLDADLAFQAYS